MAMTTEMWELVARERIRDTLAMYTWSGDSMRLDGLSAVFCEDGELEIRGQGSWRGRGAIADFFRGVATSADERADVARIARHNVTNIRFVELTPSSARVESYFTVFTEIGLDHYGRYRDTLVPVGDAWLLQHRYVATDWSAPDSSMVRR